MANDLIIALRRKRMADAADEGAGDGPSQESGGSDMAKYWAMMQDMNGKLDHLISLLSDEESKESGPAPEQTMAKPGMGY